MTHDASAPIRVDDDGIFTLQPRRNVVVLSRLAAFLRVIQNELPQDQYVSTVLAPPAGASEAKLLTNLEARVGSLCSLMCNERPQSHADSNGFSAHLQGPLRLESRRLNDYLQTPSLKCSPSVLSGLLMSSHAV